MVINAYIIGGEAIGAGIEGGIKASAYITGDHSIGAFIEGGLSIDAAIAGGHINAYFKPILDSDPATAFPYTFTFTLS